MPINLNCGCGKKFIVGDDHPGRKVRCPACQDLLDLPGANPEQEQGYALAAVRKCPHCKREWPGQTVLCVECGHNFETGQRLRTLHTFKAVALPGSGGCVFLQRNIDGVVTIATCCKFLFWTWGRRDYRLDSFTTIYTDYEASDNYEDAGPYSVHLEGPGGQRLCVYAGSSGRDFRQTIDLLDEWGTFQIRRS